MAAYEEYHATVRDCEVRVLVGGRGRPVVYVHGGGGLHWTRYSDLVAEQFRLYAVEMPGFGQSTISGAVKSIYDVADVVADTVASERLTGLGWMAESLGGLVSVWVAIRHPGLIDRLVLESPGGFRSPNVKPREEMTLDEVRHALYAHPERLPAGIGEPTQQPRGFMGHLADRRTGWEPDLRAHLPELTVPTLIINGEMDGLIGPETGSVYRSLLPNAWRICVDDAGHVIHLDEPELFASLAIGFLLGGETVAELPGGNGATAREASPLP